MRDFLIRKNSLAFKIFPFILLEVTISIIILTVIFWLLRDDTLSKAIVILAATIPALSFFYLSAIRTGLLELNIGRPLKYERLAPVIFKTALFLWVISFIALIITLLIWYPLITHMAPGFELSELLTESVNDTLHHGLGLIGSHEELIDELLVYGTLLPIFIIIYLLVQTAFTIPMASLAASMDGKTDFDPITGIGSYYWSTLLTLSVGYIILAVLLIDIILGISSIFDISLAPEAIMNDHSAVYTGVLIFITVIFPISYLAALHSSVSTKAYKRYINRVNEARSALIGVHVKPRVDSKNNDVPEIKTPDIVALRKIRQRRPY